MSNPPNSYYDEGSVSKLQRKARESPVMPIGKKLSDTYESYKTYES